MSTDCETRVSHTADRELQEIEKKYPGFIHMKLMQGIRLSYNLQVGATLRLNSCQGVIFHYLFVSENANQV